MKLGFFLLFASPLLLFSQQSEFLSLRFNEDYSYLRNDSNLSFYEKLKFHSIDSNNKIYHTLGGEIRLQNLNFTNENWEENGNHTESYQRFLLHSDWKWGSNFRLFTQVNSTHAQNRLEKNRSVDENMLDLSQLFLDYAWKFNSHHGILRIGRQEMPLGAQRLYSVREGLNNRLSFDLVHIRFIRRKFSFRSFYGHPVALNSGFFDDRTYRSQKMFGYYLEFTGFYKSANLDVYHLINDYELKKYSVVAGKENRHSVGFRFWQRDRKVNYDFESVWQFGQFYNRRIRAYTISLDLNYKIRRLAFEPVFGLRTEIISGDRYSNDKFLNTFNPLYPRGAYFGLAAIIGPSNLVDLHPYLSLKFHPKISASFDWDLFWRHSLNDALYNSPLQVIAGSNSAQRCIGKQLGLSVEYTPLKFLKLSSEFTWFKTGKYLKEVTEGKDILLLGLSVQFKF